MRAIMIRKDKDYSYARIVTFQQIIWHRHSITFRALSFHQ